MRHDFIEINLDSGEEGENCVVAKVVAIFEVSEEGCDAAKFLLVVQYLMALPVDKQKTALKRHSSVHCKNCCKLLGWELTYQRAKGSARVYCPPKISNLGAIGRWGIVAPEVRAEPQFQCSWH